MAVAEEQGVDADVVLYVKEPPDRTTLERLVSIIEDPVEDLVRKDSNFKKLGLVAEDYVGNPGAVVDLLVRRKALLQRPVVVRGDRAIVGRPKSRVAEFLAD
ncbi:MAG TPA: arsenate reductase [Acidimicrobiaceae bacterium]|nr:arsenate reductase [Acidimicrobiaceae bacterium]HCB37217.1 arsenate reductase [Acidimicrobiaceae bacterium]